MSEQYRYVCLYHDDYQDDNNNDDGDDEFADVSLLYLIYVRAI